MIMEENGSMRAYTLFGFDPVRGFEVFYIEFDAGCRHYSDRHNDGVEEYIFVVKGKLDVLLNDRRITLKEQQAIRFEANIPHAYTIHATIFAAFTIQYFIRSKITKCLN